jgi:hypothetical protein
LSPCANSAGETSTSENIRAKTLISVLLFMAIKFKMFVFFEAVKLVVSASAYQFLYLMVKIFD